MSNKYKILSAIVLIAFTTLTSCKDYLNREYEGGVLDDEQVQEAVEAIPSRVNSAVSGMYSLLGKPDGYYERGDSYRADDFGYPCVALSQDLNCADITNIVSGYDWFSTALAWSDRSPTYANPRLRFGLFYKIIYNTKAVLDAIPEGTDNADLIHARGQAEAVRAFCYLSLAPYYQFRYKGHEDDISVPIITDDADYRNNPRTTLSKLYDYIFNDLNNAITDLDGFVRDNKGQIDKNVAYGLRARAELYTENWSAAAADADSAMNGYTPYGISELTTPGFNNANDHSWIWALILPNDVISDANYASWPSQLGSFSGDGYVPFAGIYRCINKLLYDKISNTDVRKSWWLTDSLTSPYLNGLTWTDAAKNITYTGQEIPEAVISDVKQAMPAYTNVKFGQEGGVGSAYNYGDWCMMRTEEMILIKAEALAMSGNPTEGRNVLVDFVKTYRDPSYTCTATTPEEVQNAVWLQRRIELWGEGFALADVMRLDKNIVRYHPNEGTNVPEDYQFNISSDDLWRLMRFPQTEITNNPAIIQNTGGALPQQGDGATLKDGVTD